MKRLAMNRMTSDSTFEINMHQLALNQVYIEDGWAWYRNAPEDELSVCDLIRSAAETLDVDLPMLGDDDLSDLLTDFLQYGAEEPEGVLAILYRALCAMAEVRARLAAYEDTGLEPEEIMDFVEKWKQAVELAGLCKQNDVDRIKELLQAEKDGRLVVLPPNDPLTLEELREMDGEPVWITPGGFWALVIARRGERVRLINHEGEVVWADKEIELVGPVYRRKPEEGTK